MLGVGEQFLNLITSIRAVIVPVVLIRITCWHLLISTWFYLNLVYNDNLKLRSRVLRVNGLAVNKTNESSRIIASLKI